MSVMSNKNTVEGIRESTVKELNKIAKKAGLLIHIEKDKCVFGKDKEELQKNLADFEVVKSEIRKYGELHRTFMFPVDTSSAIYSDNDTLLEELAAVVLIRVHIFEDCSFIELTKAFDNSGSFVESKIFEVNNLEDAKELNKLFKLGISSKELVWDNAIFYEDICKLFESLTVPDMILLYLKYVKVNFN